MSGGKGEAGRAAVREVTVTVNALLDVAWWTREDEGTTGSGVREELYAMAGGVTDEDVDAYVAHRTVAGNGFLPGDAVPEDDGEEEFVRSELLRMREDMRADAARTATHSEEDARELRQRALRAIARAGGGA